MLLASASAAQTVSLNVTDLNGSPMAIPSGFPAQRALLLLGFRHEDHAALDVWRQGLGLRPGDADWFEVPVIGVGNAMIRSMIVHGMQRGAPTAADRAHLAPAFADTPAVALQFGVDPAQPAVVVVDRSGRILARASGAFEPKAARMLISALRP